MSHQQKRKADELATKVKNEEVGSCHFVYIHDLMTNTQILEDPIEIQLTIAIIALSTPRTY